MFFCRLMRRNATSAINATPTIPPTTPPAIAPAWLLLLPPEEGTADEDAVAEWAPVEPTAVCVLWTCVAVDSGALSASADWGSNVPVTVTFS